MTKYRPNEEKSIGLMKKTKKSKKTKKNKKNFNQLNEALL